VFSRKLSNFWWLEKVLNKLPHGHRLFRMLKAFSVYSEKKNVFYKTLLISFVAQCFSIFLFVFIGGSLGYSQISLATYFFVIPVGFMVMAIPISPAGIGIGQAAFYYLFNMTTGTTTSLGSTSITAFQCLQFLLGLLGAWYYITIHKDLVKANIPTSEN
jgi:hypothetical protein